MKTEKYPVKWFTQTIYLDFDTGEILSKKEYKKNYFTVKQKQDVQTNRAKSVKRRIIEICGRRKPQIRIAYGDQ